jgi:hypothetical protein
MLIEEFDYRNGTALAEMFFNRTFVVDEEEFFIDEFGQRQIKWWSSYFDTSTGLFVVCKNADFSCQCAILSFFSYILQQHLVQNENLKDLKFIKEVLWYGGTVLPLNEPRCGFRGLKPVCFSPGKMQEH